MPAQPLILVYGREHGLLNTRRWVFEEAGYRAVTAQTLSEVERIAAGELISLLVLCHSLSVDDCEKALTAADTMQPQMKRLLLTAHTPICTQGHIDRVLRASDGPRALMAVVQELAPRPVKPVSPAHVSGESVPVRSSLPKPNDYPPEFL